MAYTYEQVFAADPSNPSNIAQNASITIFAPGDGTMTPIAITDPDGQPLTNPLTVNANGFGSAFMHATLDRVAWAGGGFTGYFTSYEGMKAEAVAARTAADTAASNAASSATSAANSAALVGAPADTAIAAAVNGTGATKTALDATYAGKAKGAAGDTGPDAVVLNTGYEVASPRQAAFSVNGGLSVLADDTDLRLWNSWAGQNVLSVRNTADPATVDNDSAIKFLDAATGLERGAIGFHNGSETPNSAFYGATFVESSAFIQLDDIRLPLGQRPIQPFRIVTSGESPTFGYGSWARLGAEANGDFNLYHLGGAFTDVEVAIKIVDNASGVHIRPRLLVAPHENTHPVQANLDVRGQGVVGNSTVTREPELNLGYEFNVIGPAEKSIQLLREGVGRAAITMVPAYMRIVDPDNGSIILASFNVNNAQSVGLFGMENFGGGKKMLGIQNTSQAPTTNPSGGGVLYVELGALKYKGENGTVTTLGVA